MKREANMSTVDSVTRYAKINEDKSLAYRMFGEGQPIIFANRFRGNLDSWDPAFLDSIAQTNTVIIFEYSGKSLSTGKQASTYMEMAQDVIDLADNLKINRFAVAGWSLGGFVAQIVLTEFPERVSHGILIGTRAPGLNASPMRAEFFQHALKPTNDLDDEIVLFFNPKYESSKAAAQLSNERIAKRKDDLSIPMSMEQIEKLTKVTGFTENTYNTLEKMQQTTLPILVLIGEDDVCFAAIDWMNLNGTLPTTQMILFGAAGHAPQHQYPELAASYISLFLTGT